MNKYKIRAVIIIAAEILLIAMVNLILHKKTAEDRPYMVEIKRAAEIIEETGRIPDIDGYTYVTDISKFNSQEQGTGDYKVYEINGTLYRFVYTGYKYNKVFIVFNICICILIFISISIFIYFYTTLVKPFNRMQALTRELAKGNLSTPIKAEKSRYYGDFLWGMDMLREKLEQDKIREYELLKEKKTLILSMTHDIKTPLAAMELYVRALSDNLYEEDKKEGILDGISKNLKEINNYVNGIAKASKEDAMDVVVNNGEFYIKNVLDVIRKYYMEKMSLLHVDFSVDMQENCLVYGDEDRTVEVLQNVIENAVKYGDGGYIKITTGEEDDCRLITVCNSGKGPGEDEMLHIFDSFYRGSNSGNLSGSGMGLYICKKILHMMDGEIFAENKDNCFNITIVLRKV